MIEVEIERSFERIDSLAKSLLFCVSQSQRLGDIGKYNCVVADILMGNSYGILHNPPISVLVAF
jgi:hypothetical protein